MLFFRQTVQKNKNKNKRQITQSSNLNAQIDSICPDYAKKLFNIVWLLLLLFLLLTLTLLLHLDFVLSLFSVLVTHLLLVPNIKLNIYALLCFCIIICCNSSFCSCFSSICFYGFIFVYFCLF